ncbi:MAG: cytochrome c oxidase assembly protein [Burkholderiales bacterium]
MTDPVTPPRSGNARLARRLGVVSLVAFGFGFALVPLYDVFCRLTGTQGRLTAEAQATANERSGGVDTSRTVTVELMATAMPGAGWTFQPEQTRVSLHPGEVVTATYLVKNPTDKAILGQAVPSVSPSSAAPYLRKIDCFCFREQALAPGAVRKLPVTFFVSRDLPTRDNSITLSYAFYPVEKRAANH